MATDLYHRIISLDYSGKNTAALMLQVWSVTPYVVNVKTGSPDSDQYRKIVEWAHDTLGRPAWPIHGRDGDWQTGSATVYGETFIGFKHAAHLALFIEAFGHLAVSDETSNIGGDRG